MIVVCIFFNSIVVPQQRYFAIVLFHIVDKLRTAQGERPSVDKLNPDLRVHLRLERGEAIVSLDLSGHSLHQRGYRLQQGAAPLKENLAAAVLIRAGWPHSPAPGAGVRPPRAGPGRYRPPARSG